MDIIPVFGTVVGGSNPSGCTSIKCPLLFEISLFSNEYVENNVCIVDKGHVIEESRLNVNLRISIFTKVKLRTVNNKGQNKLIYNYNVSRETYLLVTREMVNN